MIKDNQAVLIVKKAEEDLQSGKISRREFNHIMVTFGVLASYTLFNSFAQAWTGSRMRRSTKSGGFQIQRSLRFRRWATTYLNRTPGVASDRKVFTVSAWVKTSFDGTVISAGTDSLNWSRIIMGPAGLGVASATGGVVYLDKVSTAKFRDPGAWYHLVVSFSTGVVRAYVNQTEITSWSVNTNTLGSNDTFFNSTTPHRIGELVYSTTAFDGYMAEFNFIDGQALTPSSFGETDSNGYWKAKKYAGTYGTNGVYFDFSDNSSTANLCLDRSGNGNNWTPNNFSVIVGAIYDSMLDVPLSLGGNERGNYCTLNPLATGSYSTLTSGNLRSTGNTSTNSGVSLGTIGSSIGKWYWEVSESSPSSNVIGIASIPPSDTSYFLNAEGLFFPNYGIGIRYNGSTYGISGELQSVAAFTYAGGDVIGVAVDADNGAIYYSKNGVWLNSGDPTSGATKTGAFGKWTPAYNRIIMPAQGTYNGGIVDMNFGQRPFSFTPPTGFKALHTGNLADPVIIRPNQFFDVTTYTGNGATQSIINSGNMQPDLVWIKNGVSAYNHILQDSTRGTGVYLASSNSDADAVSASAVTAFNSNGFSIGSISGGNNNTNSIIAWQWKKGTTPGFDIVTYTGNGGTGGSSQVVNHALGILPSMIIIKSRSSASTNWVVEHVGLPTDGRIILLNDTQGYSGSFTNDFRFTQRTTSTFQVGSTGGGSRTNTNAENFIAYLFSEVPGFSRFNSYIGNGSTDGPFIYCGFKPKYLMIKVTTTTASWLVIDSIRNPENVANKHLSPDLAEIENGATMGDGTNQLIDLLSNGFKIRMTNSNLNTSGATYIFAAFAESPFKYSLAK